MVGTEHNPKSPIELEIGFLLKRKINLRTENILKNFAQILYITKYQKIYKKITLHRQVRIPWGKLVQKHFYPLTILH